MQKHCEFSRRNGFPGIVGAVDGTHIEISKPLVEPDLWIDRHGKHSINLTAVCDASSRILFYRVGDPGSYHDSRVRRISTLPELLDKLSPKYHIIGDSAYPLDSHLLTPYRDTGSLTFEQKTFNYHLSANRMVIENCFGLLKNKFPRIHNMLQVRSIQQAVLVIRACIHLHNYIIDNQIELFEAGTDRPLNGEIDLPAGGKAKRDRITAILTNGIQ
jgi:hypothetical protein